ncbi:MAG TPA: hypothetical protein EYG92_00520, partial [Lutibacter sp.]|nr:hypothetical protein [Lutibacter sp.]
MKKMLLLFLLLTILAPTQAQTTKDPYIPVLGENKVWYTAERWEFGEVVSTVFYTSTTEIINGIEYTRIINQEGTIYAYLRE